MASHIQAQSTESFQPDFSIDRPGLKTSLPCRRDFLKFSLALAAGLPLGRMSGTKRLKDRIFIGAQTNTWGVPIKPFDKLLEIVARLGALGYMGFETNYVSLS